MLTILFFDDWHLQRRANLDRHVGSPAHTRALERSSDQDVPIRPTRRHSASSAGPFRTITTAGLRTHLRFPCDWH